MKKYLVSYGCERYQIQKTLFKALAEKSGFFDEIEVFTPADFDHRFAAKMRHTLLMSRGGGFWLWKPYFIKKMMDKLEDGDLLVYCGANCMINVMGKKRFDVFMEQLQETPTGTLAFELPYKESEYTKMEVFDYFNSSEDIIRSKQLMATIVFFRKCEHTTMLVDKWYDIACNHPALFTDEIVPQRQDEDFIAHRYDQSIFSVIRKTYGADIIPMKDYFFDFIRECDSFPFWATSRSHA